MVDDVIERTSPEPTTAAPSACCRVVGPPRVQSRQTAVREPRSPLPARRDGPSIRLYDSSTRRRAPGGHTLPANRVSDQAASDSAVGSHTDGECLHPGFSGER